MKGSSMGNYSAVVMLDEEQHSVALLTQPQTFAEPRVKSV